jgi:tetratricopeptide (TPR) repeat protein
MRIIHLICIALLGLWAAGCDLLSLEVENPNNVLEEDLENPAAAAAIANGAEATVTRALGAILAPYSTASDELKWVGSRDSWRDLDYGKVDDIYNEFTDNAFTYVAEARWTADKAIERLEGFASQGVLRDRIQLARAYAYAAIIYITIADMFDDFAFSDRTQPGPNIGRDRIPELYDKAVEYCTKGIQIAQAVNNTLWEKRLLALRARARYSKALRAKIRPNQVDTANPLVNNEEANQDAQAALAKIGTEDFVFRLETSPATPDLIVGDMSMALQVNFRLEMRIGDDYIVPTADDKKVASVKLLDPIDNRVDPKLERDITEFTRAERYAPMTVVSRREMHLILAEAALAQNNVTEFQNQINEIRSLDGLSSYTGQIPARDMLIHTRRVNLFLQGRRLADHYRFQQYPREWVSGYYKPGAFFPITISERRANPLVR